MSTLATLAGVQAAGLRMLAILDDVSNAEGHRYFLAYGSALGAVRNESQIPWDWDSDVLVPQPDYHDLIASLSRELPPDLMVSHYTSNNDYEPLFARISLVGIDHSLVHLDIFPLSGAPQGRALQRIVYGANRILSRAHVFKRASLTTRSHYGLVKRSILILCKVPLSIVPATWIQRSHRILNSRVEFEDALWLHNPCGTYGAREFFPAEWFADFRQTRLSGVASRLPSGAIAMLKSLYGEDFLTPVLPEERAARVQFFEDHVAPHL